MLSVLAAFALAAAPAAAVAAPGPALAGTWTVDLSTDPAKPYTKTMRLDLRPDHSVAGSFYDSDIVTGRWKLDRGRTCASFRTTDGAGPYHSSVCLSGDVAIGQTWAEHRSFLFVWNATRVPK